MVGRPAKTQIRVFAVRMKKAWVLSYPLSAQRRLWSDWADVQADLSLRWVHTHFVGFVMLWLKCSHLEKQVSWLFDENLGVIFHISKLKNAGIHYNDEYPQHMFWSGDSKEYPQCILFFYGELKKIILIIKIPTISVSFEPRHEKTCLRGLQPGKTQTGLLSYKD